MARQASRTRPGPKVSAEQPGAAQAADSQTERRLPATRKGRARRDEIRKHTSALLREVGYHELTLDLITSRVGMPISVFYHYYGNKRELVLELLDDMFREFGRSVDSAMPFGRWENGIHRATFELLRLYSENRGLMRCLYEVEEPEFALRWRDHLNRWHERVASGLAEFTTTASDDAELFAIVGALSGMTETLAYERFVLEGDRLKAFLPDIETAAAFITTLWVRAAFQGNPRIVDASRFKTLLGLRELPSEQ